MEHKEFVKIAVETSSNLDDAATYLVQQAKKAYSNGEISQDELVEIITNYYDPLIIKAGLVIKKAKQAVVADLDDNIKSINTQIEVLKQEVEKIESIEKIIKTITMFVGVGTAIVSAFAVPSPTTISNALNSLGTFIGQVGELNEG